MSDIEEPPTKISKYEMSQTFTQPEEMEEDAQEEWLSEGLLTDDDNPGPEQDRSDSAVGDHSMETSHSQDDTAVSQDAGSQDTRSQVDDSAIEQELTNMAKEISDQQNDLPDELGAFLIRKPDSKPSESKQEESDGNDTDDLLRMLEDDDKSNKKKKVKFTPKERKDTAAHSSGDDNDDFVYEGAAAAAKKLRVAKTVLMRKKPATRAQPEESSDETNASSDEASTVKKMFGVRKTFVTKSTAKPHVDTPRPKVTAGNKPNILTQAVKKDTPPATSTPLKTYSKTPQNKSILKPTPSKNQPATKQPNKPEKKVVVVEERAKENEKEFDEIINEEEFLDEDEFDLDEEFADESETELDKRAFKHRSSQQQAMMRPEQLDEDMYSDGDSQDSDDDSLYEDIPSSDSEDLEDWFTLDIREERAGDYLPLLGARAYELLLEEKQRVSARVDELRRRLDVINEANKHRSDKVRAAAAALADLEDMIKAA